MLDRVLHGVLALSLAPAPAADPEPTSAPSTDGEPTDDATADDATAPDNEPEPDGADDAEPADDATAPDNEPEPDGADDAEPADEPEPDNEPAGDGADDAEPADVAAGDGDPTAPAPLSSQDTTPVASPAPPPSPRTLPPRDGHGDDMVDRALLGGGIASLVLAGGLGGVATWAFIDAARFDRIANGEEEGEGPSADAIPSRDRRQTLGAVTAALGATYLITGTALLLLRQRDRKRSDKATATIAPTRGGFVISGRF